MNELTERKIRASHVAYALNAPLRPIRAWLEKGQVKLMASAGEGWRDFRVWDVGTLAITRALVDFGVEVRIANDIAHECLDRLAGPLKHYKRTPTAALAVSARGWLLFVWRTGDEWRFTMAPLKPPDDLPVAFVFVDLGGLLSAVFDRLQDALSGDDD